jgi:hypothetical protein
MPNTPRSRRPRPVIALRLADDAGGLVIGYPLRPLVTERNVIDVGQTVPEPTRCSSLSARCILGECQHAGRRVA